MKPLIVLSLFSAITAARAEMFESATSEELALQYRKISQEEPASKLAATKGADPSKVNQPLDLISQSDILCYNGAATLVPKRAVMHIPPNLADRLKYLPTSRLQSWAEFYALNQGWITTVEVSRTQAEGNLPLADEISKRVAKSTNLVVATYLGGPISVLPLKSPAETTPTTPKS
jgi:hypothetical protein